MAGGPSTAELVIAASAAGALGFLAAGDTGRMSLYAGKGFQAAATRPAAEIVELLWPGP
jgi:NAD(P)H-dependent flavin oxidoreductase YrpB (nitropropane dioxygenase family)